MSPPAHPDSTFLSEHSHGYAFESYDQYPFSEEESFPGAPFEEEQQIAEEASKLVHIKREGSADVIRRSKRIRTKGGSKRRDSWLSLTSESVGDESETALTPSVSETAKFPRWAVTEDVILTGVAMDSYCRRHSVKPFKTEVEAAKEKATTTKQETLVWKAIHKRYLVAIERWYVLTGNKFPERTLRALQKRWKVGANSDDHKVDDDGMFVKKVPKSKIYQMKWDSEYNADFLLSCSEEDFNNYISGVQNSLIDDRSFPRRNEN